MRLWDEREEGVCERGERGGREGKAEDVVLLVRIRAGRDNYKEREREEERSSGGVVERPERETWGQGKKHGIGERRERGKCGGK